LGSASRGEVDVKSRVAQYERRTTSHRTRGVLITTSPQLHHWPPGWGVGSGISRMMRLICSSMSGSSLLLSGSLGLGSWRLGTSTGVSAGLGGASGAARV